MTCDGYGWCLRKGEYLNVGIGRRTSVNFAGHVSDFVSFLESSGKAPGASRLHWHGHAYLAAGVGPRPVVADGVLLIGDAAGLACPQSSEGIRPAVESGLLAAQTAIAARGRFGREDLLPYETTVTRLHPRVHETTAVVRSAQTAVGRVLLQWPSFTRHVVLDRWFLQRS